MSFEYTVYISLKLQSGQRSFIWVCSDRLAASMSSLEDQLQAVTKERDDLQTKYEEVSDDYSRLYDQNIQLDKAYREMKGERHKDTVAMEEALKEITKEASDTLGSYNTTIQRLGAVERERDEFRMKHEQALNILAQRGQELTAARQAVQDCERSWSVTMEQRLAAQRKEAEEMQDVIRAQVSRFMSQLLAALERVVASTIIANACNCTVLPCSE